MTSTFLTVRWLPALLVLAVFAQACAVATPQVPTASPALETAPSPAATEAPLEPAPTPTLDPDPTDACPTSEGDATLYIDRESGYCLLYPAEFSPGESEMRPAEVLELLGPRQAEQPKLQEYLSVVLTVEYNGPADGLDSAAYARKWHDTFAVDVPYQEDSATIGGLPAVVLSDLPGFTSQRSAFVVANGVRYRITLSPQPQDLPELAQAASLGWETLTASLVFFPPENDREFVRAEDVCPQEMGEMRLLRSDVEGFCYLYPADFTRDQALPNMVEGGPVLTEWPGLGDVQAFLSVGSFGHFEGQTPRQVLASRMQQVDPASVQDAEIGGYPAVVFTFIGGPWLSRQAMIVVDGDVYTIVSEPWDPERFPEGIPYLERVWEAATSSLSFFEPWR